MRISLVLVFFATLFVFQSTIFWLFEGHYFHTFNMFCVCTFLIKVLLGYLFPSLSYLILKYFEKFREGCEKILINPKREKIQEIPPHDKSTLKMSNMSSKAVFNNFSEDTMHYFHDSLRTQHQFKNTLVDEIKEKIKEINQGADTEKISILKEIQRKITAGFKLHSSLDYDFISAEWLLSLLCLMFCECAPNTAFKKALTKTLKGLTDEFEENVHSVVKRVLLFHLNTKNSPLLSLPGIKISVNSLLELMDGFTPGLLVIDENYEEVWKYLAKVFHHIILELDLPPTELFTISQPLVKAILCCLRKCDNIKLYLRNSDDQFKFCSYSIQGGIKTLLMSEFTPLNCRLNAGMAFCHFMRVKDENFFKYSLQGDNSCNKLQRFPISSQLCIYSGVMATVSTKDFVSHFECTTVAEIILSRLMYTSRCLKDSDLLLLCTRDLIQWCDRMGSALRLPKDILPDNQMDINRKKIAFKFHKGLLDSIFQFVLQYRENYVDTLRHLTKDLFKKVLNLHHLSKSFENENSVNLQDLTNCVLTNIQQNPGKYGLMGCIVETVGSETILQWHPNLPQLLYTNLTGINQVSELLDVLFKNSSSFEDGKFFDVWLKPLLSYIESNTSNSLISINEHILPKLHKSRPNAVEFLTRELMKKVTKQRGNYISILVTCVKLQRKTSDKKFFDLISFDTLREALCHADDQVRISALSLICENKKTTEIIDSKVFALVTLSLHMNIAYQAPAFRQQFVSCFKKLFSRMSESYKFLQKNEPSEENFLRIIQPYKDFFNSIRDNLICYLSQETNFPRRVTSLHLLNHLATILADTPFVVVSSSATVKTLIQCLYDTYEKNKEMALDLLRHKSVDEYLKEVVDVNAMLKTALELSSSSKPDDTVTPAYLFSLLVKDRAFYSVVQLAMRSILDIEGAELSAAAECIHGLLSQLKREVTQAKRDLSHASLHAPMYGTLFCIRSILNQALANKIELDPLSELDPLLGEMFDVCYSACNAVILVVANASPEGYIPVSPDGFDSKIFSGNGVRKYSYSYVSDLIQVFLKEMQKFRLQPRAYGSIFAGHFTNGALKLKNSIRKVLTSGKERKSTLAEGGEESETLQDQSVEAQRILLCCWRTYREVSLIFGDLAEYTVKAAVERPHLKMKNKLLELGCHMSSQMVIVKHRGAFEQAAVGFSQLCSALWKSTDTELRSWPSAHLKALVNCLKGHNQELSQCTRRSAGIPFVFQAILASDPGLPNSSIFKSTIKDLLTSASSGMENSEKIHALNILRGLCRDAKLGEALIPFLSETLQVSITGFKSQSFAMRNSSTMLFSVLMTRIFGVVHSQGEITGKNKLAGKMFFSHYKDMYPFILKELQQSASAIQESPNNVTLVPNLHAILLVLGRLYPYPGEQDAHLAAFLPFVDACSASSVLEIRVLSAKALVSILPVGSLVSHCEAKFHSLAAASKENEVHGRSLQIQFILKECFKFIHARNQALNVKLEMNIQSNFNRALSLNKCYTTRSAFLEITLLCLSLKVKLTKQMMKQLIRDLLQEVDIPSTAPDKERYLCLATVLTLLSLTECDEELVLDLLSEIKVKYLFPAVLVRELLLSTHKVVQTTVLHFLCCLFQTSDAKGFDVDSSINSVYFTDLIHPSTIAIIQERRTSAAVATLHSDEDLVDCILGLWRSTAQNSSNFGLIYQLLYLMPHVTHMHWSFLPVRSASCYANKMEYVLDHFRSSSRKDISNHILLYSVQIAVPLYNSLPECQADASNSDSNFGRDIKVFKLWTEIVFESASPESSTDSTRTTVFHVLNKLPLTLLFNTKKLQGENFHKLYDALVLLLVNDDLEINKLATEIVLKMREHESQAKLFPVVPTLALEWLLEMMGC